MNFSASHRFFAGFAANSSHTCMFAALCMFAELCLKRPRTLPDCTAFRRSSPHFTTTVSKNARNLLCDVMRACRYMRLRHLANPSWPAAPSGGACALRRGHFRPEQSFKGAAAVLFEMTLFIKRAYCVFNLLVFHCFRSKSEFWSTID